MKTTIIEGEYLLEKFDMKGGWTYIYLKELIKTKSFNPNREKVNGQIDDCALENMPIFSMGNERYFISINSCIRAKIKKKVGDTVKLVLFQNTVLNDNEEQQSDYQIWIDCLENEPKAFEKFHLLEKTEQEKIIDWIAS
nr:DUF1905 domain-containing protein [Pseudarcicella sp.]